MTESSGRRMLTALVALATLLAPGVAGAEDAVLPNALSRAQGPAVSTRDKVILKDDTVLSGTLLSLEDGVLAFSVDFTRAALRIDAARIRAVATRRATEVELRSGERLRGALEIEPDGSMLLRPEQGGAPVSVDWDQVARINVPPVRWSGDLSVGGNWNLGNTESLSVALAARAQRLSDKRRLYGDLRLVIGRSDGEESAENLMGTLKLDYFLAADVFLHGSEEFLYDKFRDIRLRAVTAVGLGYQLFEDPHRRFEVEAGVGYLSEDFIAGGDDRRAVIRAASKLDWQLSRDLSFSNRFVIFPSPSRGDVLTTEQGELKLALNSLWSLKLSGLFHHDTQPPPVAENSDLQWTLFLQYAF